jgi:membrane protein
MHSSKTKVINDLPGSGSGNRDLVPGELPDPKFLTSPNLGKIPPTSFTDVFEEADRGRLAGAPGDIPPKGWRDICWRVAYGTIDDHVFALAGGIAYYALLAVFPAVAMIVSLYGLFADITTISDHLVILTNILPPGSAELLTAQIVRFASQNSGTLGVAFQMSLVIALWSATAAMSALFDALNVVYKEKEKRSLWKFYGTTLLFALASFTFVAVALAAIVVVPIALNVLGWASYSERLLAFARWPALFAMVAIGLTIVYRYGPSRRPAKWRWLPLGSVVAALLWISASMLFSWYVANFDSYNRIYGALGAIVAFQIWLWLSSVIVLLGAELNAESEHQTAIDSTAGAPRPLGSRGATMADTIGEKQL